MCRLDRDDADQLAGAHHRGCDLALHVGQARQRDLGNRDTGLGGVFSLCGAGVLLEPTERADPHQPSLGRGQPEEPLPDADADLRADPGLLVSVTGHGEEAPGRLVEDEQDRVLVPEELVEPVETSRDDTIEGVAAPDPGAQVRDEPQSIATFCHSMASQRSTT